MHSKSLSQKLLSSKTVFIAAPCLIGVTAIAAIMTSMALGRDRPIISGESNGVSNPVPSAPPQQSTPPESSATQSIIAAQPLDTLERETETKQTANQAKTATHSAPPQLSPPAKPSKPQVTSKPQPSTSQKLSSQAVSKPSQSKSRQSALTMQAFDPKSANDVPQVPIRVAIVQDAQNFTVATSEAGLITDAKGKALAKTAPQQAMGASIKNGGINLGSVQSQSSVWVRPTTDKGLVFVNGRWYRGLVQLIPDQGKLLAVNHVEMQPYLYSVVGSEMYQSWPADALKAQAIAARSYALVHIVRPASPYFDLGSTQRWQAYKGVGSEASSTLSAVDNTRGIVISHNGGVVESLYASSAELVQEAHRGFGMSQYGARDLAQQNLNYRQILSRFYPGTELSLLQTQ